MGHGPTDIVLRVDGRSGDLTVPASSSAHGSKRGREYHAGFDETLVSSLITAN